MIAVLAISAINLSGCAASNEPTPTASADGKLHVVASISNWADIAHEIGGDLIDVTALVSDSNKDPHSYEATPRDQLAINKADLVVVNGSGYDDFASKLVASSPTPTKLFDISKQTKLTELLNVDSASVNPHIWFNFSVTTKAAELLAAKFGELDPAHAEIYKGNFIAFGSKMATLGSTASALKIVTKGYKFLAPEPIANYLLAEVGFTDLTPKSLAAAVENEADIPPAAMQEALDLIKNHKIDYIVLNKQTSNAQIEKLVAAALEAEVRAVAFAELLPANTTYIAWMTANLKTLNPGM
jgi:zinc/manganese transport system substrate-binding protein